MMFHGRTKDMLKVGGENVAAAEIEAMLQTHPAVKLAQVVGIPHDRYVEVPAAFVELAEGQSATEDDLIQPSPGQLPSLSLPLLAPMVSECPLSPPNIQKSRHRRHMFRELGKDRAEYTEKPFWGRIN